MAGINIRFVAVIPLLAASSLLASCTTIATGVASRPPGIHPGSFRECLLDNGFFTPTALVGLSKADYVNKHDRDKGSTRTRAKIISMPDPEFTALTAKIMRDDLMPHLQFGGGAGTSTLLEPSLNRPYGQDIEGEPYQDVGYNKNVVPPAQKDADLAENSVNRYLDCYLAPIGHESAADAGVAGHLQRNDGDADIEGRLLRAHILLTLAANFGAELLNSRPSANLASRAERLLTHVHDAEEAIRASSPVMNPAMRTALVDTQQAGTGKGLLTIQSKNQPFGQPSLRWHDTAARILRVFQVAADIEMIDARQSLDRAKNLLAAFNQPSSLLFEGVLKDALRGLGTVQKVRLFGDAMLRDARETLAVHRRRLCDANRPCADDFAYALSSDGQSVAAQDIRLWQLWDRQLVRACSVIASAAKKDNADCIPDEAQLARIVSISATKSGNDRN